ncbi:outer membrane protein, OMP85 family [Fulvivirga imtechensis AK7]|uniref:Outer membrane protein, OMP85 family n=1 Tax=Fulvivirga imtechensis AK7 TaxID=1237149 RepID=L8JQM6_9BACT|nr:BamA/TamA family outer membrane protein [Fulvivirga imtechensis]ELR69677.1 outer membrane protein, OMP85 family [Fulvivirga imtechensis AK7]
MVKLIWLLLFILVFPWKVGAQSADSTGPEKALRIVPLPALFYTPETRLGFGGLVSGVFNLGEPGSTRNSNVEVLVAYTLNKQTIIRTKNNLFTRNEKYFLSGELSYYNFPILYYGIGNDTKKEFEEELSYQIFIFQQRVLKQVKKSFFAGPQYRYIHLYNLDYEPEYLIADETLLQNGTGINSGLGFACIYDTRDNILNATHGIFAQFSTFFHGKVLGSDFVFNRYTVDVRKFWQFSDRDVIAVQYFGEFNTGGVPFREMAQLGGEMIMRGYYNGRYRDQQQMAFQGEYRKQFLPWFGIVAFGAIGDVVDQFTAFDLGDFKYTVGGGLRVMVNKSDRLNIRIDYGIGSETSGFYFAIAEAF